MTFVYFLFIFQFNGIWPHWKFPSDYKTTGIPFSSQPKGNCQYDHISVILKRNKNPVLRVRGRASIIAFGWSGKTSPIRFIAVRETGVLWHHGGPIKGPLKPYWGASRGLLTGSPLCRETTVSWTTDVRCSSVTSTHPRIRFEAIIKKAKKKLVKSIVRAGILSS